MSGYRNVLIAVDLTESAATVIEKALQVTDKQRDKVVIIHIIDYIPYMGYGEGALVNPTYSIPRDEMMQNANDSVEKILAKYEIPNLEICIEFGTAATEIVRYSQHHDIDLIAIGSHGRHGVKMLLGSSANAVLHHAQCDVLAVRIKD